MTLSDFDYDLPEERIAQTPLEPRDSSRLMIIDRDRDTLEHRVFRDIIEYLRPEDVLVINDTRVLPARIIGHRSMKMNADGILTPSESTAPVELLLLKQRENDVWEALAGPGKRARPGDIISFGTGFLTAEVLDIGEEGCRIVRFRCEGGECETVYEALHKLGSMPLPPYIREKLNDPDRYQTVYARHEGSAAAPTAGLHFTPELLEKIKAKGCAVAPVLLHVGLGTFRPVKEEKLTDHEMHTEYISVSAETAKLINERRAAGGRVIAVGTTSCRTLESASDENGVLHAVTGDTGIFIYPGYRFKMVDALITNFHLPKSTLLMLVSALAGREKMLDAYKTAVEMEYRFFSFGDAMFIQ
ncbi:MAG: tRNA preQ1(34) S-adenosylmethionine ribosyltransferase-isomerase QueA [Ruminococcaceae bacterium]|nr:tRNA preQ1(34) S-adenosylmethionine ribosyltransferase-isomerase QueA [Oscillospiraceae bacterium]